MRHSFSIRLCDGFQEVKHYIALPYLYALIDEVLILEKHSQVTVLLCPWHSQARNQLMFFQMEQGFSKIVIITCCDDFHNVPRWAMLWKSFTVFSLYLSVNNLNSSYIPPAKLSSIEVTSIYLWIWGRYISVPAHNIEWRHIKREFCFIRVGSCSWRELLDSDFRHSIYFFSLSTSDILLVNDISGT